MQKQDKLNLSRNLFCNVSQSEVFHTDTHIFWVFPLLLTDLAVIILHKFYATWKLHRSKNHMRSLRKDNEGKVSEVYHTR